MTVHLSVTVRCATLDEIERTDSEDKVNLTDGTTAVLLDGELIGLTNEYNTCAWHADGVDPEHIERMAESWGELITS